MGWRGRGRRSFITCMEGECCLFHGVYRGLVEYASVVCHAGEGIESGRKRKDGMGRFQVGEWEEFIRWCPHRQDGADPSAYLFGHPIETGFSWNMSRKLNLRVFGECVVAIALVPVLVPGGPEHSLYCSPHYQHHHRAVR